jgi:hypothetical protein
MNPRPAAARRVIALHDQRTGQTLGSIDAGGSIRWVRITPSGVLIVGTDRAVQAYDLSDRTQRWSITRAPANDTLEAWPIGDLVYLLDTQRSLWRVPVATGLRTNEMAILVNADTRVICQGITGAFGAVHTKGCYDYGTKMVGGVTPGKGGTKDANGLPIFDTVARP